MDSIVIDPEILSGTYTMQDFLEDYPSVSALDARTVFESLGELLLSTEHTQA